MTRKAKSGMYALVGIGIIGGGAFPAMFYNGWLALGLVALGTFLAVFMPLPATKRCSRCNAIRAESKLKEGLCGECYAIETIEYWDALQSGKL